MSCLGVPYVQCQHAITAGPSGRFRGSDGYPPAPPPRPLFKMNGPQFQPIHKAIGAGRGLVPHSNWGAPNTIAPPKFLIQINLGTLPSGRPTYFLIEGNQPSPALRALFKCR